MKYYVTIDMIAEQCQTSLTQAKKIFRQAKKIQLPIHSQREVSARAVNKVLGWKEFEEPKDRR